MERKYIILEVKEKIAYVTINRPENLNSLNVEVISEMFDCFREVNDLGLKGEVYVAVFTGAGRSFIAGADIEFMTHIPGNGGRAWTKQGMDMMDFVEDMEVPVIAAVNGFALGGGCEFAMACDFRIASTKAKFGQPETGLGITPGYGGTQRLPRLVGKGMAKYLIMTGETISAAEAYRIGLVQKVVEPEELMPEVNRIAKLIASKAPFATKMVKNQINAAENTDLKTGIAYELQAYDTAFNTEDRLEGMKAFVEKRTPEFKNR